MTKRVAFLDRDGTLIVEKNYLSDPAQIEWEIGAIAGLIDLQALGFEFIIVTNQSGIGRGYYSEDDFWAVQESLNSQLNQAGIQLLDTYFCPHHPTHGQRHYLQDCTCRKPKPGMLKKAVDNHNLIASDCIMVGDKCSDILAGQALGMTSILVTSGYGQGEQSNCQPDIIAANLQEIAQRLSQ